MPLSTHLVSIGAFAPCSYECPLEGPRVESKVLCQVEEPDVLDIK